MVTTIAAVQPASLGIHALGAGVHLAVGDGVSEPTGSGWRVFEDDRLVRPPLARIRLELATGGAREAIVFRSTAHGDEPGVAMRIADGDGSTLAVGAMPPSAGAPEASIFELTDGLGPTQQLRFARFLFETCAGLFRLGDNARFLTQSRSLLRELVGQPGRLLPRCELAGRYLLYESPVAGWLGSRLTAWTLTGRALQRAPAPPACDDPPGKAGRGALLRLLLDGDAARAAEVLILGETGLASRNLAPARGHLPNAFEWLAAPDERRAGARRYVIEALSTLAAEHDHARAALRELRAVLPAARTRLSLRTGPLDGGVDLAVGCATGVFVSGWLSDPEGMAEVIQVERAGRSQTLPVRDLDRFAHPTAEPAAGHGGGACPSRRGFVLFAGERMAGPVEAPCDVTLCLASGQRLQLAEGPTRHHAGAAHEAVLTAVPRPWLTPELVAKCFEPVVRALAPARPTVDKVLEIGRPPRSARATVVIAVGQDPDLLRCRYGVFAGDPASRAVEIIHVLDRPEHAAGVRRLLDGLAAIYGIGSRLLILSGPASGSTPLEAAAAVAATATLVFLGASVVPERHGWLEPLMLRLATRRECGIAGARLVHADNSLSHAGAEIELDGPARQIDIRLPLQGFPRDYQGDWTARRTWLVSAGAFATRRDLLAEIGGFPQGYLSAELAVGEFCLLAHARGLETWILSTPTLVDLAAAAAVPGLDPALEIDRRLLEARWGDRLRTTGTADATSSEPTAPGARDRSALWRVA